MLRRLTRKRTIPVLLAGMLLGLGSTPVAAIPGEQYLGEVCSGQFICASVHPNNAQIATTTKKNQGSAKIFCGGCGLGGGNVYIDYIVFKKNSTQVARVDPDQGYLVTNITTRIGTAWVPVYYTAPNCTASGPHYSTTVRYKIRPLGGAWGSFFTITSDQVNCTAMG